MLLCQFASEEVFAKYVKVHVVSYVTVEMSFAEWEKIVQVLCKASPQGVWDNAEKMPFNEWNNFVFVSDYSVSIFEIQLVQLIY